MAATAKIAELGAWHLFACFLLLGLVVAASALLELGLEARLIVSASRCAAQLLLLCAYVLTPLFASNDPWAIGGYLGLIVALASREASSRLDYGYGGLRAHFAASFALGCGAVIAYAVLLVLDLDPAYDAKFLVPVSGMVVGNTLTSTSLGANAFLSDLAEHTDRVELALCRGASWREAALPSLRRAMTAALTPTLNSMAVMGLVMMPGMMTGQMLGGQPPLVAGAYQVMIMYLVCSASCCTTGCLLAAAAATVFDRKNHALRRDAIVKREKGQKRDVLVAAVLGLRDRALRRRSYAPLAAREAEKTPRFAVAGATARASAAVLVADGVVCARTGLECTLALAAGTATALTGETGAGKTQLLKTLARLAPARAGALTSPAVRGSAADWRCDVSYVPQDRPTVPGSPRDLLRTSLAYRAQRRRASAADPADAALDALAARWGLARGKLDEPWYTLSGGEAQRASLAIALALKPKCLLLDEPTAACDADTTKLVERDLKAFPGALLLVTHDPHQARRLCSAHLTLARQALRQADAV